MRTREPLGLRALVFLSLCVTSARSPSSDSSGRSGAFGALTAPASAVCDWSARLLFPAVLTAGVPPPPAGSRAPTLVVALFAL